MSLSVSNVSDLGSWHGVKLDFSQRPLLLHCFVVVTLGGPKGHPPRATWPAVVFGHDTSPFLVDSLMGGQNGFGHSWKTVNK